MKKENIMKKENVKNNVTEMVFILDKSGSMAGMEADTVGGFNSMIEKQKREEGRAYVTTVLFSNNSEMLHDRLELSEVAALTERDYCVGGCTALLDAIGGTIRHIEEIHRYIRPEDVPAHTVFVITTDGMENASHEYSDRAVKKMIEQKKEEGWEFLFLAANIDAVSTAERFGITRDRAVNYKCDSTGTQKVYSTLGKAMSCVRANRDLEADWCAEVDEDVKKRGR